MNKLNQMKLKPGLGAFLHHLASKWIGAYATAPVGSARPLPVGWPANGFNCEQVHWQKHLSYLTLSCKSNALTQRQFTPGQPSALCKVFVITSHYTAEKCLNWQKKAQNTNRIKLSPCGTDDRLLLRGSMKWVSGFRRSPNFKLFKNYDICLIALSMVMQVYI